MAVLWSAYHSVAFLVCALSASAFTDSSLHQLDCSSEIFLWRLVSVLFVCMKIISPAHAPAANYFVIAWAVACLIKMASIAW